MGKKEKREEKHGQPRRKANKGKGDRSGETPTWERATDAGKSQQGQMRTGARKANGKKKQRDRRGKAKSNPPPPPVASLLTSCWKATAIHFWAPKHTDLPGLGSHRHKANSGNFWPKKFTYFRNSTAALENFYTKKYFELNNYLLKICDPKNESQIFACDHHTSEHFSSTQRRPRKIFFCQGIAGN